MRVESKWVDVLADILERARARGSMYALCRLRAPWAFRFTPDPSIHFHLVLSGACLLRTDSGATFALNQGDVVFIGADEEYELADAPDSPVYAFEPLRESVRREGRLVWPGEGPATRLLCGGYDLGLDVATPFRRLPPLIHVSADESRVRPALRATIELLSDEVQGGEPGAQVVADRLVDTLLVQVLRLWLARGSDSAAWWPRSSGDVGVASVLDLIHERPQHPWTLAALAREVSMSRSTLARRFAVAMGEPPISYLTRWRMTLASELLCDTSTPLTAIAERVGYDSVFAFSNAFKRVSGEAPSHYRAMARSSVAPGRTGLAGVVAPQDG